jgi:hypothetical protein
MFVEVCIFERRFGSGFAIDVKSLFIQDRSPLLVASRDRGSERGGAEPCSKEEESVTRQKQAGYEGRRFSNSR